MTITDIRLSIINSDTAVKAIGSITFDNVLVIRGIRVMEDKNGNTFVVFPSREKSDGSYEDIVFPLTKEFYNSITKTVLEEYNNIIKI